MKTVRVNDEARCPACHARLTAATHFQNSTPKPGDITVCAYCSTLCTFNTDMTMRSLRIDELEALPQELKAKVRQYQFATALCAMRRKENT